MDSNRTFKVLATGASGFVGGKLLPHLQERGYEITTFGRSPVSGFDHITGDIADGSSVDKAVTGQDIVFHLAGFISYRKRDRDKQYQVNVIGTRNVMAAALKHDVKRVIHTSSIAAMGVPEPDGSIGDESIVYNLDGVGLNYCDTKHQAELEVFKYTAQGLNAVLLCPGIIFGEGDTHPHHHAIFKAISKGWLLGWPKGGVMFSDINDVLATHLNAIDHGKSGERYVVGSANLSYKDAAILVSKIMNKRPPIFEIPEPLVMGFTAVSEAIFPLFGRKAPLSNQMAWLSQRKIFFSFDKAVRELKYKPTPFEDTIRRTMGYYLG